MSPETLFQAVRELAYAERYDDALHVASAMQRDDRVLTYLGFINRKTGNFGLVMAYYAEALILNPKNALALSYRGMGHVEQGRYDLAVADLNAIEDQTSWAWQALNTAIQTGDIRNY